MLIGVPTGQNGVALMLDAETAGVVPNEAAAVGSGAGVWAGLLMPNCGPSDLLPSGVEAVHILHTGIAWLSQDQHPLGARQTDGDIPIWTAKNMATDRTAR